MVAHRFQTLNLSTLNRSVSMGRDCRSSRICHDCGSSIFNRQESATTGLQSSDTSVVCANLSLCDCYLSPTGVVGLSKLRNLEHLATIRVVICDEGARAISSLPNLKTLSLHFANVSDEGATHFTRLKNLESLNLSGAKVSRETAIRFGALKRLESSGCRRGRPRKRSLC